MVTNDGGPAFPVNDPGDPAQMPGMTLRDWFAGQALAGIAQAHNSGGAEPFFEHKCLVAQYAYAMADAMLKARESSQ